MEMGERASEMMAYPGNGEESNDNVHGSGAHAGLPTETTDRWVYLCTISVSQYSFTLNCKLTNIVYSGAPLTDAKQLSTREFLNCSAQEIIDDLNSKRKRDAALLEGNI